MKNSMFLFYMRNDFLSSIVHVYTMYYVLQTDGIQKEQAWFLQEVEITNVKRKKSWSFVCNNWLSLHHGDQQTTRELFPNISSKTGQFIVF